MNVVSNSTIKILVQTTFVGMLLFGFANLSHAQFSAPVHPGPTAQAKLGGLGIGTVSPPTFERLKVVGTAFVSKFIVFGNASVSRTASIGYPNVQNNGYTLDVNGTSSLPHDGFVRVASLSHGSTFDTKPVCADNDGTLVFCDTTVPSADGSYVVSGNDNVPSGGGAAPITIDSWTVPADGSVAEVTIEVWGSGGAGAWSGDSGVSNSYGPDGTNSGVRVNGIQLCAGGGASSPPHAGGQGNGFVSNNGSISAIPVGGDAGGPGGGAGGAGSDCVVGGSNTCFASKGQVPGGGGAGHDGVSPGGAGGGYSKGTIAVNPGDVIPIRVGGAVLNPEMRQNYHFYNQGAGGIGAEGRVKISWGSQASPVGGFTSGVGPTSLICPPGL